MDSSSTKPAEISVLSVQDALEVLRSQPSYDALVAALQFLTAHEFQLQAPSAQSARLVHVLATDVTPNYWPLLRQGSADDDAASTSHLELLLTSLRSIAGLNAILNHVKALISESRQASRPDVVPTLDILLEALAALLAGDGAIRTLWVSSTAKLPSAALVRLQSKQLAARLSDGRLLSTAAEAVAVTRTGSSWVADGAEYSKWIGRNLSSWAKHSADDEAAFCIDLFQRSMSLGYPGNLVETVIDELLLSKRGTPDAFVRLCLHQSWVSKKVVDMLLEHLARRFLNKLQLDGAESHPIVAAVAGLVDVLTTGSQVRRDQLVDWCTASSGAGLGNGIGVRRVVVAVLATDKEAVSTVLEKSLALFGDRDYIKHAPMLQQQVHAQVLLLSAGYVSRLAPIKLAMLLKCGTWMNAISNRIAATQARARFLGMVVGEALSALVDNKTKPLDFHMEETETDEAEWLKGLAHVTDGIGPFESITSAATPSVPASPSPAPAANNAKKPRPKARPKPAAKVPVAIIEELDSSDGGDDLVPHAKGSDPEDSDDDAALVRRDRPRAPVYIRDLIAYLRDSESYDKQKLGLQTAAVLIRRKASFGSEVSAHADELAGLLVGLQDKFDMDDFAERRQQGMIALVVAQPKSMAPWFARAYFEGDFSLAQRTALLVTLGLSARELAGHETSEHQAAASFPSKRLPAKMEQLYVDASQQPSPSPASRLKALPLNALERVTQSLTSSFLEPLAADAADATSGPDVFKLQTFSERYKSQRKPRPRVRAIANTTAALVADYFFSPLTAHFQRALGSSRPVVFNTGLLALYLQTLAIVVNAAGPSTLALPQLTSELWNLLLHVRTKVMGDVGAMKGWLVAMTVLIEVNDGNMRRLCEEQGREVLETREWVGIVFERTRGDDGGEENQVKMLAAGVLIKLGEAIEKFQALLMGEFVGFS